MAKRISYIIIAVTILVTGYFGFNKLNYWERSIRIFTLKNTGQPFEGRMGRGTVGFHSSRGAGERGGIEKPALRELPDSLRIRAEMQGEPPMMRDRNMPDSLRQQFRRYEGDRMERGRFEGGFGNRDGHGRGDFPGGKKINLRNVAWFLAVFAAFTVIVIYLDKAFCLLRKKR